MMIRALDISHDWTFGKGKENYLTGQLAIAENIQTRILSFLNNCFFDMGAGIDWFILLGTPNTEQQITLNVRAIILQSYGVVNVNSINLNFIQNSRKAVLTYNIDTMFTQNYNQTLQVNNYV